MKPVDDRLNEELLTRWTDDQLSPDELAALSAELESRPGLREEKQAARRLGDLMRAHLPAHREPESPEFFTSRIMDEVRRSEPAPVRRVAESGWPRWLRAPWFVSLASAAAVAAVFLAVNGGAPNRDDIVSRPYSPDPNVTAHAYYSSDADAVVIDLEGLEAVPDEREIRAFDIASADTDPADGDQVFHASNGSGRPVMVLYRGTGEGPPRFREIR